VVRSVSQSCNDAFVAAAMNACECTSAEGRRRIPAAAAAVSVARIGGLCTGFEENWITHAQFGICRFECVREAWGICNPLG
jgi:hypothetical protein